MFGTNPIPLVLLCNKVDKAFVKSISICCDFSDKVLDKASILSENLLSPSNA